MVSLKGLFKWQYTIFFAVLNLNTYFEIDKERRKSEKLLLNILPKKVIKELKEKEIPVRKSSRI